MQDQGTTLRHSPGQRATKPPRYVIAGEEFATKKALTERVKGILYTGACPREVVGHEFAFLKLLFRHHPSPAKRTGAIARIWAMHAPGGRRFEIERNDGSFEDISYHKPLDKLSGVNTYRTSVRRAMRASIRDQVEAFRMRQPVEVRGSEYHVDHVYPHTFDRLLRDPATGSAELGGRAVRQQVETFPSRTRPFHHAASGR